MIKENTRILKKIFHIIIGIEKQNLTHEQMDKIRCWDQFCTLKQIDTKKLHQPKEREMFFLLLDLMRKICSICFILSLFSNLTDLT